MMDNVIVQKHFLSLFYLTSVILQVLSLASCFISYIYLLHRVFGNESNIL